MIKLSKRAADLQQGGIREFFTKASGVEGVISLAIGEPDFDVPDEAKQAMYEAVASGKNHYSMNSGIAELRKAISEYYASFGVIANPEDSIIVTCGGMSAVSMALLCSIDSGDEVLVQDPQWLNYFSQIEFACGRAVHVPVTLENRFILQVEDLEKRITPRSKVLIINSPNNPTGSVIGLEDLRKIAEFACKHDLIVISDEVYCELTYDGRKHISIASLPGMAERTIIVNSMSKTFAMTGWRIGYCIGPSHFIQKMIYLQENFTACAPVPAQYACATALAKMPCVEERRDRYEKRRKLIVDGLNSIPGVRCLMPEGAFYAFPDFSAWGMASKDLALRILREAHVAAVPGSCFGEMGEHHLRFSYASSEEKIQQAIDRINHFARKDL